MSSDETKKKLTLQILEFRVSHGDWRDEARKEWKRTGSWSRMLGGGFVSSSKDPDDWEHPYLK